jgi:hypothetical protein
MSLRTLLALLPLAAALAACEDTHALKTRDTRDKLVGTWLREMEANDAKARRLLVLEPDGKFSETLVVEFADGRTGREERGGEWAYDGINLKRRYMHEDGRPLLGIGHFVTFAVTELTPREFEGKNYVQGEEIRYRRVPEGTVP